MAENRSTRTRRVIAAIAVAVTVAVGLAQPADARDPSLDRTANRVDGPDGPRADVEVIQLGCAAQSGQEPAIGCRWPMVGAAAGYRLIRSEFAVGTPRTTVARIDDPSTTSFVDAPVRRGVRYGYVVRAYDASGNLIASSRPAVAGVAVPPTIQQLRLQCSTTSATTVRCSIPTPVQAARTLTVWRSVDGAVREVVDTFETPFPASYGDVVPAGTSRVAYAVIATDGSGEIVARSRAEIVTMPRPVVDTPERDVTTATDRTPTRPYGGDDVARPPREADASVDRSTRRTERPEAVDR